ALTDPDGFRVNLETIAKDVGAFMDRSVATGRELDAEGVLDWWRRARMEMLEGARGIDPSTRIPWYGPPMSPASFVSARQMETWAHGQDVADTLGIDRDNTARIRNVAHIGVLSRKHSYVNRGLAVPEEPVLVELKSPDGETWTWGDGAENIKGSAVDFCLVVTQRRHPHDTRLEMDGPHAREWMSIAQAYAGPPGPGRKPGQFVTKPL
ncbi:MAG: TIGR03084 family metal-binding protein, partial [Actinomycetota bacterium]